MSSLQSYFRKFLAVEAAGGASWHPDGSSIAFIYDAPGVFQIYNAPIEKNRTLWPTRISFEDNRSTNPKYLSDGTLLFTMDKGGDENFQIAKIEPDMTLEWITTDSAAKHIIDHVSNNSYFFSANIEDKARFDIYHHRLPLDRTRPEIVFKPVEGLCQIGTVSTDEKHAILEQYFGNNNVNLLKLDIASREAKNLTKSLGESRTNRWEAIRWIDRDRILVATDYAHDMMRLGILSLSGDFTSLREIEASLKHEFDYAAYSPESTLTYFILNEGGFSSLWRGTFSADGVRALDQIELPRGAVIVRGDSRSFQDSLALSPNHEFMAMTMSTATLPTNIWILDLDDHTSWKATDVGTAGLNPSSFVNASLHNFLSFDSLPVPYFRYIPKGDMPERGWPAILMIHGGPEAQILPNFQAVIQFFLSTGYAIFTPNIRGSTGYGRAYMDMDNVERRLDSVMDIKHLALHIKANEKNIDGDRLVIYGGSYGGFAVLSAMTEHPDLWKAGVDIVGISNFVTFLENTAPWRRALRESEYGSLESDSNVLNMISPIHKIDNITAPLIIIQGDNDERVPLSESVQMYEKLKEKGLEVELMRFADEGHGLAKLENRIKAYSRVVEWLKEIV
ncbi:MAG: prolyl oligopeptidase family serine peptidase [Candidatus Thorarchaeota archaeon]